MIGTSLKLFLLGSAFLFASPQSLTNRVEMAPTQNISCGDVLPVVYSQKDWRALTRRDLETLGQKGDRLGLYYLAQRDLRSGREKDAIEKLERAAAQGLVDAYRQLASLYASQKEFKKQRRANYCLSKLTQFETLVTD